MALVYPLVNDALGQFEEPIDFRVDGLVAHGFYPQKSNTAFGSQTSTTGIEYDSGDAFLVVKTEGTKISFQVAGNEYALIDNTGLTTLSKLRVVNSVDLNGLVIAYDVGAKNLTGFESRTTSTLSFVDGTRTFTVAPTGASFNVWANNKKYAKTSSSVVIANTVGLHFVYFDATGTLVESTSTWDLTSDQVASVATVYWSGTAGVVGDERHGYQRDRALHIYLHTTRGTAYDNGLAGTFTNTTFSIATGAVWDEDLKFDLAGPFTTCRLWYRNASSQMQFTNGLTTPYAVNAGVIRYDNAGTLTDVPSSNYVMNWVYATNDGTIAIVVGQAAPGTLINARAEQQPNFPNMSTREWKLLYSVLYRNAAGTPTFIEAVDYRNQSSLPNASVTSLPAISVTFIPTGVVSAVNVQAAIETLARVIDAETPTGAVNSPDGTTGNAAFTVANTPVAASLKVYVNGVRQVLTTHYTLAGSTITFTAGNFPMTGSLLVCEYRY